MFPLRLGDGKWVWGLNRALIAETHGFNVWERGHKNQQRSASKLKDSIDLYGHTPVSSYLATPQFFKIQNKQPKNKNQPIALYSALQNRHDRIVLPVS